MDAQEIQTELRHSFNEWGVTGNDTEFYQFRRRVLAQGSYLASASESVNFKKRDLAFDSRRSEKFPCNVQDAYELILRTDLTLPLKLCVVTEDGWNAEGFGEPYYEWTNERTGASFYKLKPAYSGTGRKDLDPFHRYTFQKLPKADYFYHAWFLEENVGSAEGGLFEARWACHAIRNESCFHCKCRKSLRWSGGTGSAWQDLVCIRCKSMFELKTKASMVEIEKVYRYNNASSGSFSSYCSIVHSRNHGNPGKMFLVLLPRKFAINGSHEKVHPVFIAEIDRVKPRLCDGSFNTANEFIRLRSQTSVKLSTKRRWFDLPHAEEVHINDTKKKIFVGYFGQAMFDKLVRTHSPNLDIDGGSSGTNIPPPPGTKLERKNEIKNIIAKLDDLKVQDDAEDWENTYASD